MPIVCTSIEHGAVKLCGEPDMILRTCSVNVLVQMPPWEDYDYLRCFGVCIAITAYSLTLGAHAQRGLRYCCCVSVCLSVCLSVYGAFNSLYDGSFALKTITPTERVNIFI